MNRKLGPKTLASAKSYWALIDQSVSQEACEGDRNTLDGTMVTGVWTTIGRDVPYHPRLLDFTVHSFWRTVLLAAQNYEAQNPKQDLILRHILVAREIGALTREAERVGEEPVLALTSNGQRLWIDLPFLVEDFYRSWLADSMDILPDQRRNLAAFIARLASVGVCGDELMGCALLVFRDVFETPRKLISADSGSEVSVEDLLPAVAAWFDFAHHKLHGMVERSYGEFADAEAAALGQLASNGGISQPGFSPSRWSFWKQRVAEMSQSGRIPEASRSLQVLTDHE